MDMTVRLITMPTEADWMEVKRRALVTMGLEPVKRPDFDWKRSILEARHSPIRFLQFGFYIECPSWVSVHLCRHIHAQPYVKSQRNDRQDEYDRNAARQDEYDRNAARQDAPVRMIYDVNAEELMTIANKRLCSQAAEETQQLVQRMCDEVEFYYPEFKGLLVPMCEYHGGVCHEMHPCWRDRDRQRQS